MEEWREVYKCIIIKQKEYNIFKSKIITSITTWESDVMYFNNMNCLMHIIQRGDTLYSISRRYDIPISTIFRANPFVEIYNLQVGEELCIPLAQATPPVSFETYVIEDGDTIENILERFGINYEELLQFNNTNELMYDEQLEVGMVLQIPIYQ